MVPWKGTAMPVRDCAKVVVCIPPRSRYAATCLFGVKEMVKEMEKKSRGRKKLEVEKRKENWICTIN